MINFSQQLPADSGERDNSAFTMDSLYHKLKGLGMLSAFDQPDKAIRSVYEGELPAIDALSNTPPEQRPAPSDPTATT